MLTFLNKKTQPAATVVGLDGDPEILGFAKKKADEAGLRLLSTKE
jgi:hypothetical protein